MHARRTVALTASSALIAGLVIAPLATSAASAAVVPDLITHSAEDAPLSLSPIGSYETGVFDESAAEIVAAYEDRLFVVNAQAGSVSVLDYADATTITPSFVIASEGTANSVAVRADGLGVIAVEAVVKTDPGHLVFFDAAATSAETAVLGSVEVGALPDMVTISADGSYAVAAIEGEPADDFRTDPEGSVAVVALPATKAAPAQDAARNADFHAFEAGGTKTLPAGVRVFGPTPEADFPVSRNLEPEYIAIDGGTAYAALQEANAVAVVDLATATVTDILPLGFKDYATATLDPSDRDPRGAPTFSQRSFAGLYGMYQPDGMASYSVGGETYLVTANEGDAREWGEYSEVSRVKDLTVCADSPLAGYKADSQLGRLNVTKELGFDAAAGCYDELYSFGGRSFSIWTTDGTQVFDSGSDFEEITHTAVPEYVNSNHSESNLEGRSDDKGPEPEGITLGTLSGRTYAFIGFERVGGVAVYDITDPAASRFVTYVNNRDFSVSVGDADDPAAVLSAAGDLGPEGLTFIPAEASTTGTPLLAVANEVSGTVTLFEITDLLAPQTTDIQVLTINDFHGRLEADFANGIAGAAVVAGAVGQLETENPNTLFVSAGDNIGASTFTSFIAEDNPTIDALAAAGLDASAVGNHEFDRGFADLTDRVLPRYGDPGFGLGANVYLRGTTTPALQEYVVKDVDGIRVAFIGTVTEDTAAMVTPTGIADIEFGDQLEAANRVAAKITEGDLADVIVLLAHSGTAKSDCAAVASDTSDFGALTRGASPTIDAIVSAHTHQTYACTIPDPEGAPRPVIQALEYGKVLGSLDISVDDKTREVLSITGGTVPLVVADKDGKKVPAFPADADVAKIVADAAAVAKEKGAVEVGAISADILRGGTAGSDRGVESSLGNLVADMYLWSTSNEDYAGTPAQIALMNPGGLRADLLRREGGAVTYKDVASVQPFANTLVTVTLTGAQLKQILEEQWQPAGSSRPKLHLGVSDGFTYEYDADPAATAGNRIGRMWFRGAEITPTDTFTVVTNSFLAAGGDNFTTFAAGTARTDTGQVDLEASVRYFESRPVVDPAPIGRAVPLAETPTEEPWAVVTLAADTVPQGGTLSVEVSGLESGQQIGATLFSEPIVVTGIPAAGADGRTSFTVAIPADFAVGAHRLVITAGERAPIEVGVTVTAAGGTGSGAASGAGQKVLDSSGGQVPWGIALGGATLLVAGLIVFLVRRRRAA